jgi:hypothetical protein
MSEPKNTETKGGHFEFSRLEQQCIASGDRWLQFLDVDSMYCGIYHLPAGCRDDQRPHPDDEVYLVQKGRSKFHIDGAEIDVAAGAVLFVPAGAKHYFHDIFEDVTMLVFFSRSTANRIDSPR